MAKTKSTWKADLAKAKREGRALLINDPINPALPHTRGQRVILCLSPADAIQKMIDAENAGCEAELLTDEGEANGEAK